LTKTAGYICRHSKTRSHYCCEGCTRTSRYGVRRCVQHENSSVAFHGDLWYTSVAIGRFVQCPLGCWYPRTSGHVCKRQSTGPFRIRGHGVFHSRGAMVANLRQRGTVFVGDLGVDVVTATRNAIPAGVRVMVPAIQATFVCVTWADAQEHVTKSFAFVPPWKESGDTVSLHPRIECNTLAKPIDARVLSVAHAGLCITNTGSLWGRPWLKIMAIIASPCAARRYPWLTDVQPTSVVSTEGATVFTTVHLFEPFGCLPPAATAAADGTHTCVHCRTVHKTFNHYAATCAPDAVV